MNCREEINSGRIAREQVEEDGFEKPHTQI